MGGGDDPASLEVRSEPPDKMTPVRSYNPLFHERLRTDKVPVKWGVFGTCDVQLVGHTNP